MHHEVLAPPDLERIFGLLGGNIFQGEQGLDQMAFMRPTPALAQYATPVDGLYLCGAGTHPGGGVMAAGGHNAAKRILHDQRWKQLRRAMPSRNGHAGRGGGRRGRERTLDLTELDARAGGAPGARAPLRRGGADPARGAGRAGGGRLPDEDVARIRREALAARAARRAARPRARRAGLDASRVVARSRSSSGARPTRSPGTCRPPTTCSRTGSPEQIDRYLRPALRGELHDAYAVTEEHAGSDPSGIATTARAPRRRLADRRREVVRDLRRRRGGLHRDGERARARGRRCSSSTRRCRASRSSTTRRSRTPIRTGTRRSASTASRSATTP